MGEVLITGASGFVGHHLAARLAGRNDVALRCLVRSSSDRSSLAGLPLRFVEGDLTDPTTLRGICDGVDVVYHCACAKPGTFAQTRDAVDAFEAVNVAGTLALARAVLQSGVRRFVHLSSTGAMGVLEGEVDETVACHPTTPYGRSKREAEIGLLDLHRDERLPVVILRPCLVLGSGRTDTELLQLFRLVRRGVFPVFKGGFQIKPLVHVADLVSAMELAARRAQEGEVYLVTSGAPYSVRQVAETAASVMGKHRSHIRVPMVAGHLAALMLEGLGRALGSDPPLTRSRLRLFVADRRIDIGKMRALGYRPEVTDLEEMLREVHTDLKSRGHL
jgi:nucleoside-diphosphate-sugar epimerase